MHLSEVVSDADVLVALEPDELGLRILQVLSKWSPHIQVHLGAFLNGALTSFPNRRDEIGEAIREAWTWLEGQALLIQDPRYCNEIRVLSRKARRLAKESNSQLAPAVHKLPKESLHWSIREDVWTLYHRGKYDTAVFEAMKSVEVMVWETARLEARDIGTGLVRKAFAVDDGPLTDKTTERSEQEALSNLFAGAIGAYKNPHSHRRVQLDDPNVAAEIILLANHLLRIVEARRP